MPFKLDEAGNVITTIDGQEKKWTPEEFSQQVATLQKGVSAESRFQEAARMKQEAEGQVAALNQRVKDLLTQVDGGSASAYAQLLEIQGVTGEAARQKMAVFNQVWEEAQRADTDEDAQSHLPPRKMGLDDLDDSLKEALNMVIGEVKGLRNTRTRDKVYSEVDQALDKDPNLKVFLKEGPQAEKLRSLAKEKVRSRVRDGEQFGAQMLQDVAKELRELAVAFGAGSGDSISIPGLGSSPSLDGMGPQAAEPPALGKLGEPGYGKSILQKLAWHVRNG